GYGVAEEEDAQPPAPGNAPAATGPVAATPPVRRLARELGVDLATLAGSGPEGRITREDVERAASGASPASVGAGEAERIPVRGTRRLVAEKMARSVREIPHVTTFLTVDCSHLTSFREELERREGRRVSPLAVIVRALVDVCGTHPLLNASFDAAAGEIVAHRDAHVGV